MADFHRLDIQEKAAKHQDSEKRMDEYWINQVSWCPSDEYFEIGLKGEKSFGDRSGQLVPYSDDYFETRRKKSFQEIAILRNRSRSDRMSALLWIKNIKQSRR